MRPKTPPSPAQRLADAPPAVAVGAEPDPRQVVSRRVVCRIGELFTNRSVLAGLWSEVDGGGLAGQVGKGEHRAAGRFPAQREDRSHTGVEVAGVTGTELGTVAQAVQRPLEPPEQRRRILDLRGDV